MHEGHHDHCCSKESSKEGCCGNHAHSHDDCGCGGHSHDHGAAPAGGNETIALLEYMLKHNEHHTIELETVKQQLETMGLGESSKQMGAVIEEYQKGNVRLAAVLASIKGAI